MTKYRKEKLKNKEFFYLYTYLYTNIYIYKIHIYLLIKVLKYVKGISIDQLRMNPMHPTYLQARRSGFLCGAE